MAEYTVNAANGDSIQAAINSAQAGDTIILTGHFIENVLIDKAITLISSGGPATTSISNNNGANNGTVVIAAGVNDVQIGDLDGHGITINGFDIANPAIETAAVYVLGASDNLEILGNKIVADGEAALLSNWNVAITDAVVSGNEFAGKTFTGAAPAVGNQYTVPNVARQLVAFGNGDAGNQATNITFTNNVISGNSGAGTAGNNLVTIDSSNSNISGNMFTGYAPEDRYELRNRGNGSVIEGNTFTDGTAVSLFANGTGNTIAGNVIGGNATAETMVGTAGDDVFKMSAGNDTINGLGGSDTVDYSGTTGGIVVTGTAASAVTNADKALMGNDILSSIENVIGGSGSDTFAADNDVDNTFVGGNGNDRFYAGTNDTDTFVYTHTSSAQASAVQGEGYLLVSTTNGEGNDELYDVDRIEFSDGVTITVEDNNAVVYTRDDVGSTADDTTALSVSAASGVLANDINLDQDVGAGDVKRVDVAAGGQDFVGTYGTLHLNQDGSYTYTPNEAAKALDDGESAEDVFNFGVTDGEQSTPTASKLTITVNGSNQAPVITSAPVTITVFEDGDLDNVTQAGPGQDALDANTVLSTASQALLDGIVDDPASTADVFAAIKAETGSDAEAFAIIWDVLDEAYVIGNDYYNALVNEANIRLDVLYVKYLEDGGKPLTDVIAKYKADAGADGIPDRVQTLHDNMLGNLDIAAIDGRFPVGHPVRPIIDALLADNDIQYITGRPWHGGYQGDNAGPSHNFDATHGLVPQTSGQFTATDVDVETLTWSGTATGTYGTLTVNGDGTWTYVLDNSDPDTQALAEGEVVTETFQISVTDGTASATQAFTVNVTGSNDAPEFTSDLPNLTLEEDESFTISAGDFADLVAQYTSDAEGDDITVTLSLDYDDGNPPTVITIEPGQGFSYTPPANFNGNVAVSVQIKDSNGAVATDSFTLEVTPQNDAPTLDNPPMSRQLTWVLEDGSPLHFAADAPGAFAPAVNLSTEIAGLFTANGNDVDAVLAGVKAELGANATDGDAIAYVWKYLDTTYGVERTQPGFANGSFATNVRFVELGLAYKDYLAAGGEPLTGVLAKYTPDGNDAGTTPDRQQSLHDNILGNLNSASLAQRFNAPSNGDNDYPGTYSSYMGSISPTLLNRPVFSGNEGATNNSLPYDQANGLLPKASGQFFATDIDGDTVTFSGSTIGTSYGTFTVNPDGTWSFVLDNSNPAVNALNEGETLGQKIQVSFTDGHETVSYNLSITIKGANDAPVIVSEIPDLTIDEDEAVSVNGTDLAALVSNYIQDVDSDNLTLTLTLTYPAGSGVVPLEQTITIAPGEGLNYTPPANFHGTVGVTLVVTDEHGASDSDTFTLTVNSVNDDPVINYTGQTVFSMDEDGQFTVTPAMIADMMANYVSDVDHDNSELSIAITLTYENGGTEIHYINPSVGFVLDPSDNFNGAIDVKVTITDPDGGSADLSLTVNVEPVNDAPVFDYTGSGVYNIDEDGTVFISSADLQGLISANVSDVDNDLEDLTFSVKFTYPGGAVVTVPVDPSQDFSYALPANFNGTVEVKIIVADPDGATDELDLELNVISENDAPVLGTLPDREIGEDEAVHVSGSDLAALVAQYVQDVEGDDITVTLTLTYPAGSGIAAQTITILPGADLDFTPPQDFFGDVEVSVLVEDGNGGDDTGSFTLTINPENDAPVLDTIPNLSIDEDEVVHVGGIDLAALVAQYVTDADGDDITVTLTLTYPAWTDIPEQVITILPGEALDYTPPADFNGEVSVAVLVEDGNGGSDTGSFTLTIDPENDAPVLSTIPNLEINEDEVVHVDGTDLAALVAQYVDDVDGDAITVTLSLDYGNGDAPTVITINPGDDLDFTPPANFYGDVAVSVLVEDGNGGSDTGSFTLTINSENDAPVLSEIPHQYIDEDEAVHFDGADLAAIVAQYVQDVEGDDITVTLTLTYPAGSGISPQTITVNPGEDLDYTPPANFHGDVIISVLVDDGNGGSDTGSFKLTIDPENDDPTVTAAIAASVDENYSGAINLLQYASDVDGDSLGIDSITLPMGVYLDGNNLRLDAHYWDYLSPGESVVLNISYDVIDGHGGSVAQTLQLTINGSGEVINGTDGDDPIVGTNLAELINAGAGDDFVTASGGNDEVHGGDGDDTVSGGSGHDTIYGDDGDDQLAGGSGNDTIYGGDGDDLVIGDSGNDVLYGNAGIDTLQGGSNNDTLNGGADKDYLSGGSGNDIFVISSASDSAVGQARDVITDFGNGVDKIDISAIDASTDVGFQGLSFVGLGTADRTVAAGTMKYYVYNNTTFIVGSVDNDDQADFQIELTGSPVITFDSFIGLASNLVGTTGVDNLVGTARNEWMFGREGADTIFGGGGKDRLSGGDGADTFVYTSHTESTAGANRDVITDWQSVDKIQLTGMDANLTVGGTQGFAFMGEGSADRVVGLGELKYYYAGGNTYVVGDVTGDNDADFQIEITGIHVLTNDNFVGLASGAIVGTDAGETIHGTANGEAIIGKGGNDIIIGHGGKDVLTGGAGNDTFVFLAASDSAPATRDTIMDFAVGDKIDLSAIDANDTLALDQAFTFNSTNHDVNRTVAQGEVRFYNFGGNTYVIANSGADTDADIQIEIKGTHTLTAADFVL